jgi:hypothetical protein
MRDRFLGVLGALRDALPIRAKNRRSALLRWRKDGDLGFFPLLCAGGQGEIRRKIP